MWNDLPVDIWADMLEDAGEDTALLRMGLHQHCTTCEDMFRDPPTYNGSGYYAYEGCGAWYLYSTSSGDEGFCYYARGCGRTHTHFVGYGEMMYTNHLYEESGDANTRIEPPY